MGYNYIIHICADKRTLTVHSNVRMMNILLSGVFIPVSHMPGQDWLTSFCTQTLFWFALEEWCAPVYLRWMQYFSFLQFGPQHVFFCIGLRANTFGKDLCPFTFTPQHRLSCCPRCQHRYAIKILGVVEFKNVPHKELVLDAQDRHLILVTLVICNSFCYLAFAEQNLQKSFVWFDCSSWKCFLEDSLDTHT